MMRTRRWIPVFGALFLTLQSCAQQTDSVAVKTEPKKDSLIAISWQQLANGIDYCETDAPFKSVVNDSRLTILRIDPEKVTFEMHCASEMDKQARTVDAWADTFDLDIVFNAGMYDLAHKLTSRGYLKNHGHINQGTIHPTFNSMFAFHPTDTTKNSYDIIDLECQSWEQVKKRYSSYAQGLRMLDCDGKPMNWTKRKQSCSMLVAAKDGQGRLVLIFTRSPYLHNDMIRFLQLFPMKLTHAIYMEGGPETSLYVNIGNTKIEKVGSYVSQTYENDLNDHYWKLPNVIGIKLKEQ
jgi:hypothetical protein